MEHMNGRAQGMHKAEGKVTWWKTVQQLGWVRTKQEGWGCAGWIRKWFQRGGCSSRKGKKTSLRYCIDWVLQVGCHSHRQGAGQGAEGASAAAEEQHGLCWGGGQNRGNTVSYKATCRAGAWQRGDRGGRAGRGTGHSEGCSQWVCSLKEMVGGKQKAILTSCGKSYQQNAAAAL